MPSTEPVTAHDDLQLVVDIYHRAEQLLHDNPQTDAMFDGIAATLTYLRANGVDLSPALRPGGEHRA